MGLLGLYININNRSNCKTNNDDVLLKELFKMKDIPRIWRLKLNSDIVIKIIAHRPIVRNGTETHFFLCEIWENKFQFNNTIMGLTMVSLGYLINFASCEIDVTQNIDYRDTIAIEVIDMSNSWAKTMTNPCIRLNPDVYVYITELRTLSEPIEETDKIGNTMTYLPKSYHELPTIASLIVCFENIHIPTISQMFNNIRGLALANEIGNFEVFDSCASIRNSEIKIYQFYDEKSHYKYIRFLCELMGFEYL